MNEEEKNVSASLQAQTAMAVATFAWPLARMQAGPMQVGDDGDCAPIATGSRAKRGFSLDGEPKRIGRGVQGSWLS